MNKIMLKYLSYLLTVMLTSGCLGSIAQDSTYKVSIVSPTAAALGKYGDIPIGYHTGTPNISIPLYTVKAGKLSLPVSLSYHASGLKVQEQASWVGAGWSLNAGGVIARTVVGEPDDRGYNNSHVTNGHYSDYGYNSYLFVANPGGQLGVTFDGMVSDDVGFEQGRKDGEPDLFFFNFGGYTGKFYFNDDRTPIFVPEQDFKVQTDLTIGPGFNGFIITTPDGVQYYFGSTGNTSPVAPIEVSTPSTEQNGPAFGISAVTAWYLNKIVSADGIDSIKFSYSQENYSDYTASMFPIVAAGYISSDYLTSTTNENYNLVKNFIQGVRLNQISFPNGILSFTPAASPRSDLSAAYSSNSSMYDAPNTYSTNNPYPSYALGSIQLSDNHGFCKKDSLYYSYFHDNSSLSNYLLDQANAANIHSDAYLLRLDSLQETSCDGSLNIPPYKFSYFSEPVFRKLSFGIDHWGFSNGVNNSTLTPSFTLQSGSNIETVQGANRDAAWPAMRGGALQQITYPTGGNTRFVFQPHDTYGTYTTPVQNVLMAASYVSSQAEFQRGSFTTSSSAGGDVFEVDMYSNGPTVTGNLVIYTASGDAVGNFAVNQNGSSNTYFLSLQSSTTYTYVMYGSIGEDVSFGVATGTLSEWVPTTIEANLTVGGLRIDSVINYDGISAANNVVTTYDYGGTHSNGILYSRPVYVQSIRNDIYGLLFGPSGAGPGCPSSGGSSFFISPGSILPMATTQGSHIGYNQVTVSQPGNGSSIYQYYGSDYWDPIIGDVCTRSINITTCDPSLPNFPYAPLPFDYMRGELEYEAHLNQAGKYLKDAWHFPTYIPDSVATPAYIAVGYPFSVNTMYQLQSAYKTIDSVVETDYDTAATNNYLTTTTTTYYGSRFHHQTTSKVTSTSTGDLLSTNMQYAADFRISTIDNLVDSLTYYKSSVHTDSINFYSTINSCTPQSGGFSSCLYPAYQNFRRYMALDRINYVNRRLAYQSLVSTDHAAAKSSADSELKPILELQDEYYNPALEITSWKNTNLLNANFTRFDYASNPATKVYPQRTQLINLRAPSATFSSAVTNGANTSIVKDSRYLDESFYNFNLGNPTQVTGHDGIPVSYIWDYVNTEPIAKVMNATMGQVAYTSFEADGTGNWTIASSARDSVTAAITGRKSYQIASGNISISGLSSSTTYTVSYWSTNGSYAVTNGGSPKNGKTIGAWTYYVHTVTGTTSVTISGSSGNIDELRLYPLGAQMTTYTYQPLVGMTSQCDMGNRVTYYEYDGLQRLKRIRDQDYNILKTYDYQYQYAGCGPNCFAVVMQTLAGTNTLGYPVGVFDVHGKLLGNAMGPGDYVTLWNYDTADSRIGTLSTGSDSLHFNITLNTGMSLPASVTGLRYYQYDLPWNQLDGIQDFRDCAYVDFGDGTGMYSGKTLTDTSAALAPNTRYQLVLDYNYYEDYIIHTYPDTSTKILTFYHNDAQEMPWLDNANSPATSLTKLRHFRGNLPQHMTTYDVSSYQQASALTFDSIANWSSIHSLLYWGLNVGDGINLVKNFGFAQDFLQYNTQLQTIQTSYYGEYASTYYDSTFKLSRLKSDWNTYFTALTTLEISDDQWNREDLSGLPKLINVQINAANQNHSNDPTNNPIIPMPPAVIDNIINQVAAGSGRYVNGGVITLFSTGSTRTSNSDNAVTALDQKGWTIQINGITQ